MPDCCLWGIHTWVVHLPAISWPLSGQSHVKLTRFLSLELSSRVLGVGDVIDHLAGLAAVDQILYNLVSIFNFYF